VEAVVRQYAGSRPDGDYSPRSVNHYLRPDGQAMVAYNPASHSIGASEPEGEDNLALALLMPSDVESPPSHSIATEMGRRNLGRLLNSIPKGDRVTLWPSARRPIQWAICAGWW
jgi:hypothetical protein